MMYWNMKERDSALRQAVHHSRAEKGEWRKIPVEIRTNVR